MSNAEVRGKFIWHELLTTDTAAAGTFYTKVLPWRTQPSNMPGYTIFMAGQSQIAGLMALPSEGGTGTPAHWLVYIGTPNVDATCSQAQGLGARLCKAATDIPNVGRFAVLADPQGATFAVFTPSGGPPPAGGSPSGTFSWHELATTDVAAALRFYGTLFGWSKGVAHDMGAMGVYQIFEHGGAGVGGMANTQGPSTPPSWLSYVNVADSNRAVTSAKAAGGRLLHGPVEVPGGSWIALFMDPQGGAFAVQEMPRPVAQAKPASPPQRRRRRPRPYPRPRQPRRIEAGKAKAAAPKKKAPKKKVAKKKAAKKKAPRRRPRARRWRGSRQGARRRRRRWPARAHVAPRPANAPSGAAGAEGFRVSAARGLRPRGGCAGRSRLLILLLGFAASPGRLLLRGVDLVTHLFLGVLRLCRLLDFGRPAGGARGPGCAQPAAPEEAGHGEDSERAYHGSLPLQEGWTGPRGRIYARCRLRQAPLRSWHYVAHAQASS